MHVAFSVHAAWVLERPRWAQVSQRLFRKVPGRLAARRLRRVHSTRRCDHLRPLGCGAEPWRCANRDRRDLPPGGASRRGAGESRHRPAVGSRRTHRRRSLDPAHEPAVDAPAIEDRIRRRIRENASPRHVPARIVQVTEIPRTRSGKIVELAVRDVVHGRDIRNREAIANPEALEQFRNRPELES